MQHELGMKRGLCEVSPERLGDLLHLPEGTDIDGAYWDARSHVLILSVRHPDLALVTPGHHAAVYRVVHSWG